ncbi:MAG: hypothetical protein Q6370_012545 [Candidatus Sigynarchaeota archaeon]
MGTRTSERVPVVPTREPSTRDAAPARGARDIPQHPPRPLERAASINRSSHRAESSGFIYWADTFLD